jgi:hypothetical protein
MKIFLAFATVFFLLDIKYYKPPGFTKHKAAMTALFIHHLLLAVLFVGWIYFPLKKYAIISGGIVMVVLISWKLFDNECLISSATKALGPKEYEYCPFMGPVHMFTGGEKQCIELYYNKTKPSDSDQHKQDT